MRLSRLLRHSVYSVYGVYWVYCVGASIAPVASRRLLGLLRRSVYSVCCVVASIAKDEKDAAARDLGDVRGWFRTEVPRLGTEVQDRLTKGEGPVSVKGGDGWVGR